MYTWRESDPGEVREELAQIASIGFDVVRIFALAQDFIPLALTVDAIMIARLVEVVQILDKLSMTRTQLKTLDSEIPELAELSAALDKAMNSRNSDAQAARDARNSLLTRRTEQAKLRQEILDLGVALEIATGRPLLSQGGAN